MRRIKFRGKRLDNGEWRVGSLLNIEDTYFIIEDDDFSFDYRDESAHFWFDAQEYEVDPNTIGQFTGLHDKNGKEIYEGDIIKRVVVCKLVADVIGTIEIIGVIEWHQTGFIFKVSENDIKVKKVHRISHLNTEHNEEVEIIGNIHNNPELIKRKYK